MTIEFKCYEWKIERELHLKQSLKLKSG